MLSACQYSACLCPRLEPEGCADIPDFDRCPREGQTSSSMDYAFLKCMTSVVFEETDMWDFLRWVRVMSLESVLF